MQPRKMRRIVACALIVYSAILIRFVVFEAIPTVRIGHMRFRFAGTRTGPGNFIPFKTILPLLSGRGNHLVAWVNLLGNIVPFMPVGFLAAWIARKMTFLQTLVLGIFVGFAMEFMEVVFHVGIFDVDDITLNALGVVLGWWLAFSLGAGRQRQAT